MRGRCKSGEWSARGRLMSILTPSTGRLKTRHLIGCKLLAWLRSPSGLGCSTEGHLAVCTALSLQDSPGQPSSHCPCHPLQQVSYSAESPVRDSPRRGPPRPQQTDKRLATASARAVIVNGAATAFKFVHEVRSRLIHCIRTRLHSARNVGRVNLAVQPVKRRAITFKPHENRSQYILQRRMQSMKPPRHLP